MKLYEVVIIGGGPAGLTAALYTTRRALKTLVVSQNIGGQAGLTSEVENYPGFEHISGPDLMEKFKKHAEKFGTEFLFDDVKKVEKRDDGQFIVKTASEDIIAEAVILAFGLSHRHLDVPGEERLTGKGVSYCSTCDGPFFKQKTVAVVGGGNSGVEAAIYMSKLAKKVYLIHRRNEFTAEEFLVEQLNGLKNVEKIMETVVTEVKGEQRVSSIVTAKFNDQTKINELAVDGLFVEVGLMVKADFIKELVKVNARNEIIINPDNETSEPGIFAAGDVTTVTYKQIVISAGEGSKAALQAYLYLQKKKGKTAAMIDWVSNKK